MNDSGAVSIDFLSPIVIVVGALIVLAVLAATGRLSRRPPADGA